MLGFDTVAANGAGATNHVGGRRSADHAEQALLHMITVDPNRTPNFVLFGNDDYFSSAPPGARHPARRRRTRRAASPRARGLPGITAIFQNQITHTWLGMVGPGRQQQRAVRQGLHRSHRHPADDPEPRPSQGRLRPRRPASSSRCSTTRRCRNSLNRHRDILSRLAATYKDINAPRGTLGRQTLRLSTVGLSGNAATYTLIEAQINDSHHPAQRHPPAR